MADFTLNGRTKVKTLKANFKENFGATLRVYKNVSCKGGFADEDATLASIRADGCKGGDLMVKGNMQVGNFEKKVAELYGIGIQVANADDSALADNLLSLCQAGKSATPQEKLYDVILLPDEQTNLGLVKAIKDAIGIGLKESLNLTHSTVPVILKQDVTLAEAKAIKAMLEEEGGLVKLK